MVWTIEWEERSIKELKKLDKSIQKKIIRYMEERVARQSNPRALGKGLLYEKFGPLSSRKLPNYLPHP